MVRYENMVESQPKSMRLTFDEAERLVLLGKHLASNKEWWGTSEESDRSVIKCTQNVDHTWNVKVENAIGIIAIGELQIKVSPKIPMHHFLYLAQKSKMFPRVDQQAISAAQSKSLFDIIAQWFIEAAEHLLRGELAKGYSEITDGLDVVRGRVQVFETACAFYRGNLKVFCEYEEFNTNVAVNRVIRAAGEIVASAPTIDVTVRRRAKRILSRMEDIGDLQYGDLRCEVDRVIGHYRNVLTFAKYLVTCCGVQLAHGTKHAWTFLIRTPDIMEAGVREILASTLGDFWGISKGRMRLENSSLTLNPDLIFGINAAMGDIKYKLANRDWVRTDLYQIVTFSAGFRSGLGLVIGFSLNDGPLPPPMCIGDISIKYFAWDAREECEPVESGERLALNVCQWLTEQSTIADMAKAG